MGTAGGKLEWTNWGVLTSVLLHRSQVGFVCFRLRHVDSAMCAGCRLVDFSF